MRQKFHVKKGDHVVVTTGSHKGKTGSIEQVMRDTHRVIVKGVNIVKRHMRPNPSNPNGVLEKEMSLHISNVAHYDSAQKKASKMGMKLQDNGKKIRILKKTGKELG